MMGTKLRTFAPQIDLSLEESVPQDHFYRYLDQQLDLSFVSTFVEPRYAQEDCLPIDPVVFFKLQLVMFFEGIRAVRQLMRQCNGYLAHPLRHLSSHRPESAHHLAVLVEPDTAFET